MFNASKSGRILVVVATCNMNVHLLRRTFEDDGANAMLEGGSRCEPAATTRQPLHVGRHGGVAGTATTNLQGASYASARRRVNSSSLTVSLRPCVWRRILLRPSPKRLPEARPRSSQGRQPAQRVERSESLDATEASPDHLRR